MKDFNGTELRNRTSRFTKVRWAKPENHTYIIRQLPKVQKAKKGIDSPIPFSTYNGMIVPLGISHIGMEADPKPSKPFRFDNKSLANLSDDETETFDSNHWDCVIKYEKNSNENKGRIYIENVEIEASMHGGTHTLPVFQSIQFKDVVIAFDIEGAIIEIPIDVISDISPISVTESYGYRGVGNYQAGVCQRETYSFQCANVIITVEIEYSFTFMYPNNDFEPTGVIDASKIYPQICIYYIKELIPTIDSYYNEPNLYEINVPSGKNGNKIKVKNIYARTKIVCNNNSSHHLNNLDNNGYDRDYFGSLRNGNHVPLMFEKKYVLNKIDNNIVGFYTDSNTGTIKSSGNSDNRARPSFEVTIDNWFTDAFVTSFQPAPLWNNIFDYGSYNHLNSTEFNAVNNKNYNREITKYYPINLAPQPISIKKKPRQGAFDNIHLHGYFGSYLDNNQPVIHAPICGYCCFHLHWRWSGLNDKIVNSYPVTLGSLGFEKAEERRHNPILNYRGWGKSSKSSSQEEPFTTIGAPLIPSDQTLYIAVTPTTFIPETLTGPVINPETIVPLEQTEKTIWYSIKIENEFGEKGMHLSMEQGCGYAFNYSDHGKTLKNTFSSGFPKRYRNLLTDPQNEIPGVFDQTFLDYVYSFDTEVTRLTDTEFFEMQYRFMRFFNQTTNGRTQVNQVPIINMGAIGTDPNSDDNYGSLLRELMNL